MIAAFEKNRKVGKYYIYFLATKNGADSLTKKETKKLQKVIFFLLKAEDNSPRTTLCPSTKAPTTKEASTSQNVTEGSGSGPSTTPFNSSTVRTEPANRNSTLGTSTSKNPTTTHATVTTEVKLPTKGTSSQKTGAFTCTCPDTMTTTASPKTPTEATKSPPETAKQTGKQL